MREHGGKDEVKKEASAPPPPPKVKGPAKKKTVRAPIRSEVSKLVKKVVEMRSGSGGKKSATKTPTKSSAGKRSTAKGLSSNMPLGKASTGKKATTDNMSMVDF